MSRHLDREGMTVFIGAQIDFLFSITESRDQKTIPTLTLRRFINPFAAQQSRLPSLKIIVYCDFRNQRPQKHIIDTHIDIRTFHPHLSSHPAGDDNIYTLYILKSFMFIGVPKRHKTIPIFLDC